MKSHFGQIVFGIALILCAFFAGSQANIIFACIGFLCFFTVGVAMIVEGFKKMKKGTTDE